MNVTNGENLSNLVNLKERFALIKTWVLAKQLGLSPIKNLGISKTASVKQKNNEIIWVVERSNI